MTDADGHPGYPGPLGPLGFTATGREPEVHAVRHRIRRLRAGSGGVLLVEGEAGAGRSTLLGHALSEAAGLTVLQATADEFSPHFPLQVLQDALGDPGLTTIDEVLSNVAALVTSGPVLLCVDDLQWADATTLLAWHRLSRLARSAPLLLVGAHRPVPHHADRTRREDLPMLRRALTGAGAEVLTLGPLPETVVDALLGTLVGPLPGPLPGPLAGSCADTTRLRALAARTGGNPRYLADVIDLAGPGTPGSPGSPGTPGTPGTPGLPPGLAERLEHRLAFLTTPTRRLLGTAALLGDRFSIADLAVLTALPVTELLPMLDEARTTGLLAEQQAHLTFRHPILRDALAERVPAGARLLLHRQAAHDLARAGSRPDVVCGQLLASLDPATPATPATPVADWIVTWLLETGTALVTADPAGAERLLRAALRSAALSTTASTASTASTDKTRDALTVLLVQALFHQGRTTETRSLAGQVLRTTGDADVIATMSWILTWADPTGREATEAAADLVRTSVLRRVLTAPDLSPWGAQRLRATLARRLEDAGDHEGAVSVVAPVVESGTDPLAVAVALGLGLARGHDGTDIEQALRLITGSTDPAASPVRRWLHRRLTQLLTGPAARRAARDLLAEAECSGSPVAIDTARVINADLLYRHGDWDRALELLAGTASVGAQDHSCRQALRALRALIALHRGDAETAAREITTASAGADETDERLTLARALLAELRGHPEEALAVLTSAPVAPVVPILWRTALTRLRLTLTGDEEPADETPDLTDDDPLRSAQHLENQALVHARQGDLARARAAHSRAGEIYLTLGAQGELRRLDTRLKPFGVHRRRGPRRPVSGWPSLTPAEVSIAQLVAEGHTNADIAARLFVSRRTVEGHVSHVLAKLGLRSRVELARDAGRRSQGQSAERTAVLAG
ncbi:LuxR family transcriptional regulator [Kineosporia sp. NBRC 101731]|uniref:LuxR C-terminal-related transcriptional regulator n=1 Tax=Kineosporia sp. NBRC 101731 TaxID=3032199 RepID=UPI0025554CB3|nr:LuxR family transcriptional regulator [Kineosporia sp. NBRC 101731]